MRVTIAWWDLADSDVTIEALEQDMRNSIAAWHRVEGLLLKLWIADRDHGRWGAVMWWDRDLSSEPLPPNRAVALIGRPPTFRTDFEVVGEAIGNLFAKPDHHQDRRR